MRFFITGGLGFIGYHISKKLIERGHEVIIYDNFLNFIDPFTSRYSFYLNYRRKDLEEKCKIIKGDVRDFTSVIQSLKDTKPDIVIHLAAIPLANISNLRSQEAVDINLNGTANVLECLRNVGINRFIYASSSFVYGNFLSETAIEEHPTNPIDVYGGTKLCGEILTKVYSKRFGIDYTIIRPSAVYGPTDCNNRVSQLFIENALLGRTLTIDNNGGAVDFTYVDDTAEGFILASLSKEAINQTFNITAGRGRTAQEFADIISSIYPITYEVKNSDIIRPKRGGLDITKAKLLLDYKPRYQIEFGIPIYLEFVKRSEVLNG